MFSFNLVCLASRQAQIVRSSAEHKNTAVCKVYVCCAALLAMWYARTTANKAFITSAYEAVYGFILLLFAALRLFYLNTCKL